MRAVVPALRGSAPGPRSACGHSLPSFCGHPATATARPPGMTTGSSTWSTTTRWPAAATAAPSAARGPRRRGAPTARRDATPRRAALRTICIARCRAVHLEYGGGLAPERAPVHPCIARHLSMPPVPTPLTRPHAARRHVSNATAGALRVCARGCCMAAWPAEGCATAAPPRLCGTPRDAPQPLDCSQASVRGL